MAKQRKTRKEKIRSTLRQKPIENSNMDAVASAPGASSFSYKLPTTSAHHSIKSHTAELSYDYIGHDLRHTLIITGAIILAQLILYVLLQTR